MNRKSYFYILTFIMALLVFPPLHEFGHIVIAKLWGIEVVNINWWGYAMFSAPSKLFTPLYTNFQNAWQYLQYSAIIYFVSLPSAYTTYCLVFNKEDKKEKNENIEIYIN